MHVWDGMLAEKLLWLGYPSGYHSMSLATAGNEYLGIELDKSVRGKIIYSGLTSEIIDYAANDVKYLPAIKEAQLQKLTKENLLVALNYENHFVLPLAYMEYCGIKLDESKWRVKMNKDQERLNNAKVGLDD